MKKVVILLAISFYTIGLAAQAPGIPPSNGKNTGPEANRGHLFGKVADSLGKAMSNASVLVLQMRYDSVSKKSKEILLKAATTKGNGEFEFDELPIRGKLNLKVSSVGYATFEQGISFLPSAGGGVPTGPAPGAKPGGPPALSFDKDLGVIRLKNTVSELQNVVVTSSKSLMRLDIDKKVFNVDKNIVSEGGTAVDVLKNVPSLQVDLDGNVSLRNSSPQIFVDGLPTTLTLEQIPANAIETVEVITNPSAKYDASGGGAGILNIVLKKNKKTGYNGNVRAGVNKYGAIDGGMDFNLRQNKFNFSAGINLRQANNKGSGIITRTNLTDQPLTVINQVSSDNNKGTMIFGRLGLDYFLTNKTTISITGMKMHGDMQPSSLLEINTDSLYSNGTVNNYSQRNTASSRVFNGQGLTFGLKHIYREGEELTANLNYFTGKANNSSIYTTDYYNNGKESSIANSQTQKIIGGGSDKNVILQADYTNKLSSSLKLEAGVRAAIRSRINLNDNYVLDNSTNEYTLLPSAASNYKSSDNVYAAYSTLSGNIKKFGYKVGLRIESSDYKGELTDTKQTFSNNYPVSLFPSLFLSQRISDKDELQLSYTRRINRPNFFQLIPFIDSTDKLNIRKGNPALVPEFTQSFELNYLRNLRGNSTLLASLYYRKTDNLITGYLSQEIDLNGNNILVNSFINANSAYAAGSEITIQNNWTKWWNTSTDLNVYNSKINTSTASADQAAIWSWFAKFNSNFKLPSDFNVQLSAMYQSKTNLITSSSTQQGGGPGGPPPGMGSQSASQGYIKAFYAVDLAVKKSFFNNKISATASLNDIFRSRKQDQYSYSSYFTQDYSRIRDPQMFRLTLAYSFGKIDANLFKRKTQSSEQLSGDSQ